MNRHTPARLLAAGALLTLSTLTLTQAQSQAPYLWLDEKGLKVYSDRPPPPSMPLKNVLRTPRRADGTPAQPAGQDDAAAVAPDTDAAKSKAAPSMAERNADYLKRGKDQAERAQKNADAQQARLAQADNCERARSARQAIDSGVRISTQEKNGERGFMSDEQRAAEGRKIDKVLAACQ